MAAAATASTCKTINVCARGKSATSGASAPSAHESCTCEVRAPFAEVPRRAVPEVHERLQIRPEVGAVAKRVELVEIERDVDQPRMPRPLRRLRARRLLLVDAVDDLAQAFYKLRWGEALGMRAQPRRRETRSVEAAQHRSQRLGVGLVEEEAGVALDDRFERAAATIRDRRTAARRRLDRDQAEVFFARHDGRARIAEQFVETPVGT